MSKKPKKAHKKANTKQSIKDSLHKVITFVARHRVTLMILLFGVVVGFSVMRAGNYSNPLRNETKFEELSAGNKIIKIDQEKVNSIKSSIEEEDNTITEDTDPDRTNPFSD